MVLARGSSSKPSKKPPSWTKPQLSAGQ